MPHPPYRPGYSPQIKLSDRKSWIICVVWATVILGVAIGTAFLRGKQPDNQPYYFSDPRPPGYSCFQAPIYPGQKFYTDVTAFEYAANDESALTYDGGRLEGCAVVEQPFVNAFSEPASWPSITIHAKVQCENFREAFITNNLLDSDTTYVDKNHIWRKIRNALANLNATAGLQNCISVNTNLYLPGPYVGFRLTSDPEVQLYTQSDVCRGIAFADTPPSLLNATDIIQSIRSTAESDFAYGTNGMNPIPGLSYNCYRDRRIWLPWYEVLWEVLTSTGGIVMPTLALLVLFAKRDEPNSVVTDAQFLERSMLGPSRPLLSTPGSAQDSFRKS